MPAPGLTSDQAPSEDWKSHGIPERGTSITAQRSGDALSPGRAGGSSIPSLLPNCASGRDGVQRAQARRAPQGLPGKHSSRALLGNKAPLRAANGPGAGQSHSSPCPQCLREQPWVCSCLCLLGNGQSEVLGNGQHQSPRTERAVPRRALRFWLLHCWACMGFMGLCMRQRDMGKKLTRPINPIFREHNSKRK